MKEIRQLGRCLCGNPVVKIYNSEVPTCRTDGIRFIQFDKEDHGGCLFRCPKCSKVIEDLWSISN